MLLGKIDQFGKLGWATVVLLGFWLAWPIGLMTLAFMVGSGRLALRNGCAPGSWFNMDQTRRSGSSAPLNSGWGGRHRASGNRAFDDYRDETLRRLEEEEREFQAFLERLRKARDKSEFDAFMAERRDRSNVRDVSDTV